MHAKTTLSLLFAGVLAAAGEAIPVIDASAGASGLPVKKALAGLGGRVQVRSAAALAQAGAGAVLVLDGGSDLQALALTDGSLERFVAQGGGVLLAGLADTLPHTAALWRALGAAAPADVPGADLFRTIPATGSGSRSECPPCRSRSPWWHRCSRFRR